MLFIIFLLPFASASINCNCSTAPASINPINHTWTLYPRDHERDYCSNTYCYWKFDIDIVNYTFVLSIQGLYSLNGADRLTISNCKEDVILDYNSTLNQEVWSYTQDSEICVTFNSSEDKVGWWLIKLVLDKGPNFETQTFQSNQIITVVEKFQWDQNSAFTFTTKNGTLQLFPSTINYLQIYQLVNISMALPNTTFYVYDSPTLTNYLGSFMYPLIQDILYFNFYTSSSGYLTVWCPNCTESDSLTTQFVYRIEELHSANCMDLNVIYVDSTFINGYINYSIQANYTGSCRYSLLIPNIPNFVNYPNFLPYFRLTNINYMESSNVVVVDEFEDKLFEFNEADENIWKDVYVSGQLITFIVPVSGKIKLDFKIQWISGNASTNFDHQIKSALTYFNYPIAFPSINITYYSYCTNGIALFNVSIIKAVLPDGVWLLLYSGENIVANYSGNYVYPISRSFNASMLVIMLVADDENETSLNTTFLIEYEGKFINYTYEPPGKKSIWWIIAISVGVCTIIMIGIIVGAVFHHKKSKKRFEQLYDILREMNMPPEEIEKLKRKSDEMLIEPGRIHINFDTTLGQGAFSTVYKGRLIGPSPLHLITKSISTQKFCNCDVAVKIGSNFGQNEVEQLFKEIEAMRMIGHHENIMCMLGWIMSDEKPCLVFDVAKCDLLKFVKEYREKPKEEVPVKIFVSILWQVAKGMQYIASKNMVHRDLAARNVLLTDNYTAKITDFGLCCTLDESFTYQAAGRSKKLPIKWLSIEALIDRTFSEKSDIWSFGVLMYEVFSLGKVPYAVMNNDDVLEFLQEGKRLERPEFSSEGLYDIMKKCWKKEVENRPNFGELVEMLYEMLERLNEEYAEFYTTVGARYNTPL